MFTIAPEMYITIVLSILLVVLASESLRKAFSLKEKEDAVYKEL